MFNFFIEKKHKLTKFFVIGITLTGINLFLIYFFVDILNFNTVFLENFANIITIEIGIILSFLLNRKFTWPESRKSSSFLKQIIRFHSVVGFTAILRICLFIFLQYLGFNYFINTLLCIMLTATINFILYDKKVFK